MKLTRLALAAIALSLATPALLIAQNWPPPNHDRGGWDTPPQEFQDVQRQGFHDGLDAAHNDFDRHIPPNVERREEFRHPRVPPPDRDAYREGFRRGYDSAFSHFRGGMGGPPMPMAQNGPPPEHERGGWDAPPPEFRDVQRQGFHDGLEAGRSDFDRHTPPSAERRREFRHPPVPGPDRDAYREGFRRGYDSAFSHFREGPDRH
jgi:hypothetical protein